MSLSTLILRFFCRLWVDILILKLYNLIKGGDKILELHERIKYIRKDELKLTQDAFGNSLGVSRDVVNNWERGRVDIKDYVLKLICKTFRVSYAWLSEGIGEPFVSVPDIILDDVAEEYGLDEEDRLLMEEYAKLPPEVRAAIKQMLKNVFAKEKTPE